MPCETCKHAFKQSNERVECRRYPPEVIPVQHKHPMTGDLVMGVRILPRVMPIDYACGEFKPTLVS
jgi:hypothetical protein